MDEFQEKLQSNVDAVINDDAVQGFKEAVAVGYSRMRPADFAVVFGKTEEDWNDGYVQQKMKDFQQIARLLGEFDANTLTRILAKAQEVKTRKMFR